MRSKFSFKLRIINMIVLSHIYLLIEVYYKAICGDLSGIRDWSYWSLIGQVSMWQLVNGLIMGFIIGQSNEYENFYNMKLITRCLLLGLMATTCELITGIVLNLHYGLAIWNYQGLPYSFLNQINLFYSIGWMFICVFGIWLDDLCTYIIYDEGECPNLFRMYKDLFTLK